MDGFKLTKLTMNLLDLLKCCFFLDAACVCVNADKNLHSIFYSEIVPYSINRISTMNTDVCRLLTQIHTNDDDNSNHHE